MAKKAFSPLPALQTAVLAALQYQESLLPAGDEGVAAPFLAEELKQMGEPKSYPAFYYLLARMEAAKLVESKFKEETLGPYKVKQKFYWSTPKGRLAYDQTIEHFKRIDAKVRGVRLATI